MATGYSVNYDDKRFAEVESDKKQALRDVEKTYGGMINDAQGYYDAQIEATEEWADKQTALQQQQTDFTIEQIERQKELAEKDYIKEQSGAYTDWKKQSNPFGANAEQMAAQGLSRTGYSESSQVSMYNTYQTRITAARESYTRAVADYDIAIKDARLKNNAVLAEIAYNTLQKRLELSLEGFQYKNTLLMAQADKKQQVEESYYRRYQDVLTQINTENALAEEIRQYNQNYALQLKNYELQQKEYEEGVRQFNASLAEQQRQFNVTQANKASSGGGGDKKNNNSPNNNLKLNNDNNNKSSGATPDMKSVVALGRGPINAATLNKLVEKGAVVETEKNGKLYFENAKPTLPKMNWSKGGF